MTEDNLKRADGLYRRLLQLRTDIRKLGKEELDAGDMYAAGSLTTVYDTLGDAVLELEFLIDYYENNE